MPIFYGMVRRVHIINWIMLYAKPFVPYPQTFEKLFKRKSSVTAQMIGVGHKSVYEINPRSRNIILLFAQTGFIVYMHIQSLQC